MYNMLQKPVENEKKRKINQMMYRRHYSIIVENGFYCSQEVYFIFKLSYFSSK
jgi:hypothetical protein